MSRFGWGLRDDAEPLTTGYDPRTGVVRALPCGAHASRRGARRSSLHQLGNCFAVWPKRAPRASASHARVAAGRRCPVHAASCLARRLRLLLCSSQPAFPALWRASHSARRARRTPRRCSSWARLCSRRCVLFTPCDRVGACTPAVAVKSRLVLRPPRRRRTTGSPQEQTCSQTQPGSRSEPRFALAGRLLLLSVLQGVAQGGRLLFRRTARAVSLAGTCPALC